MKNYMTEGVTVNRFWNEEQNGYIYDDMWHGTAEDLYCHMLNFCGCGLPDDALKLVRDFLFQLHRRKGAPTEVWEYSRKKMEELVGGNTGMFYMVLYKLAEVGWEEHGGTTPGWLSKEGEYALNDLTKILEEN